MRFLSILALGAPLASAIQFTDPAANSTLTKGSTFDLRWSSVDTDPTTFNVYLVNFVNWPPFYTQVASDIETSSGEVTVRVPCDVDNSSGFQLNAINGTNVYVIYAQTPKFSVTGDACTDPVSPTSATCAAATATVTVTVRGNSTSPAGPTITGAPGGAGNLAGATGSSSTAPVSTFQGTCPGTIGWSGGYGNPVTLTETPYAGRTVVPTATAYTTVAVPTTTGVPASSPGTGNTGTGGSGKSCSKKRQIRQKHRHSERGHKSPVKRWRQGYGS